MRDASRPPAHHTSHRASHITHHTSRITRHTSHITLPMKPQSFRYDEQGAIATITLNRPDKLNALTFEVYAELRDLFRDLQERKEVRVVIITGAGRAFCSGGDVNSIIGELFSRNLQGLLEFTRMTCDLIKNIRALRKPVIASLNGTTAGAGRGDRAGG